MNFRLFAAGCGICQAMIPQPVSARDLPNRIFAASVNDDPTAGELPAVDRSTSANNELLLWGEPVVVSATKNMQTVSDAPAAVTVIDEEMIRLSGATTIPELLRLAPGVDVFEANKSQQNVSIRGFNTPFANTLLVMVDGRSIYDDFYGGVLWNLNPLLLSRIKRIEIVRGPGSALYGANAFAGVINIIMKTPEEMLNDGRNTQKLVLGEHDSQSFESTLTGGSNTEWSYTAGLGYNHTNGYGDRQPGNVRDSYTVPIATFDAQRKIKRGTLLVSAGSTLGAKADLTAPYSDMKDVPLTSRFASLTYNQDSDKAPITVRGYANTTQNNSAPNKADLSKYDFEVQQQQIRSAGNNIMYGASFRMTTAKSILTGPQEHNQTRYAVYAQDESRIARNTALFAGLRLDHHSAYGSMVSPHLSVVRHLEKQQTVRISYGTAFREPNPVESYIDLLTPLFGDLSLHTVGNPRLRPAKITSFEAGYRKDMHDGYTAINVFDNTLKDLFINQITEYASGPGIPPGIPVQATIVNGPGAHATGFEVESQFRAARGIRGLFNYSYQRVRDAAGNAVLMSPRDKINVALEGDLSRRYTGYLAWRFAGSSVYTDATNVTHGISAHGQVDARVSYKIIPGRQWTMSIGATNLLNDQHMEFPALTSGNGDPISTPLSRTIWLGINGKL